MSAHSCAARSRPAAWSSQPPTASRQQEAREMDEGGAGGLSPRFHPMLEFLLSPCTARHWPGHQSLSPALWQCPDLVPALLPCLQAGILVKM